jgi:hypothetical protein
VHERRDRGPRVKQSPQLGRDALNHGRMGLRGCERGAGESVQVRGGVVVELQRARQALEHLLRRSVIAALLQAHVVVDAEPGQRRELFATQPRHAAPVVLL